jgi:membrane protease YdiL (CAAX protease family)
MKINLFIMLPAFVVVSYLSIPGAIGVIPGNAYSILMQRLLASVIFAFLIVYYSNREFLRTIFSINTSVTRWLAFVIVIAFFLIPLIHAAAHFNEKKLLVFRISWTSSLMVIYFINSGIYYLLYEITLRGIFLSWLEKNYSTPLAVSFNVLVYAYMHIPKSLGEAIACIPFGLLLCIATIRTRSILPAMLMHFILGLSLEGLMIYNLKY